MQLSQIIPLATSLMLISGGIAFTQGTTWAKEGSDLSLDPIAIYRQAGISQEQEERIKELAREFEEEARVRAQRTLDCLKQLKELSLSPDPDEGKVLVKQEEINNLQAEAAINRIKLLLKIRSILTPTQKEKLVALLKEPASNIEPDNLSKSDRP